MPRITFIHAKTIAINLIAFLSAGTVAFDAVMAGQNIQGAGAASCGNWTESRKVGNSSATSTMQLQWVMGFLSAYNIYKYDGILADGVFTNIDLKAVAGWLDNYCKNNPLKAPFHGALELAHELDSRQ